MPRVKKYDREDVLVKGMWVFWEKGYQGTSIQDLVEGMGINRFSIYDAFESKEGLFRECLQKYRRQILDPQIAILADRSRPLEAIEIYLESLVALYTSGKVPPRCLMISTLSEMGNQDEEVSRLVSLYLHDLTGEIESTVTQAGKLGRIRNWLEPENLAQLIIAVSQSITLQASVAEPDQLRKLSHWLIGIIKADDN